MTRGALLYLIARSTLNSLRHKISRLRQPRYLLPTLAGAGYLWFVLGMPGIGASMPGPQTPDFAPVIRSFAGVVLLVIGTLAWQLAPSNPTLLLSEPEVTQLFTAPLSRKQIIRYRLLRAQPALLFMAMIATLLATRRPELNFVFAGAGAYCMVNVLLFHGITASLVCGKLQSWGAGSLGMRIPGITLAGCVGMLVLSNWQPFPGLRQPELIGTWIDNVFNRGFAGQILWPLRQMAAMASAPTLEDFAPGFAVSVCALLLLDQLATRLNTPFEESALALAQNVGRRVEAFKRGGLSSASLSGVQTVKPSRFRLSEQGPIWRAMMWKNIVGQTRGVSMRLIAPLAVMALVFGIVVMSADRREIMDMMLTAMLSVFISMLLIAGPQVLRNDLRSELQRLDYLKSLPVRGRDILRGEVYGSAALISLALVTLVLLGVTFIHGSDKITLSLRAIVLATAAFALPPVAAMAFALENGAAVLMPSWVVQAPGSGGVEMMGRNMLMAVMRLVVIPVLLLVPGSAGAGVAFLGLFFLGQDVTGLLFIPLGGLVGGVLTMVEVELLLVFFGRRLETLDPGLEQL